MVAHRSPRQEIWRSLLLGQRSMLTGFATELKADFGLTVPDFEALLALSEAPNHLLQSTALARSLVYSSGSASNLIARLEAAGHVTRASSAEDARVIEVSLTAAGSELIERAAGAHLASVARVFEPLVDEADVAVLLSFARRLAEHEGVAGSN